MFRACSQELPGPGTLQLQSAENDSCARSSGKDRSTGGQCNRGEETDEVKGESADFKFLAWNQRCMVDER